MRPLLSDFAVEVMNRAARGELPALPLELLVGRLYATGYIPGLPDEEQETVAVALKLRDCQLLLISNSSTGQIIVTTRGWEHVTCPRALALRRLLDQHVDEIRQKQRRALR